MTRIRLAAAALALPLAACSFEVEQPRKEPGTASGRFQLVVLQDAIGGSFLLDTADGTLFRREVDRWVAVTRSPLE